MADGAATVSTLVLVVIVAETSGRCSRMRSREKCQCGGDEQPARTSVSRRGTIVEKAVMVWLVQRRGCDDNARVG